jgi:y4mF family transcriptional regulator
LCTNVQNCLDSGCAGAEFSSVVHDRSFIAALAGGVRARREALGLTQVELAELAGCSTRFVHTVEAGKPTLRLDAVLRLLATLGLRLELTGPGSTGPADLGERGR